jgi:hypothetical protein
MTPARPTSGSRVATGLVQGRRDPWFVITWFSWKRPSRDSPKLRLQPIAPMRWLENPLYLQTSPSYLWTRTLATNAFQQHRWPQPSARGKWRSGSIYLECAKDFDSSGAKDIPFRRPSDWSRHSSEYGQQISGAVSLHIFMVSRVMAYAPALEYPEWKRACTAALTYSIDKTTNTVQHTSFSALVRRTRAYSDIYDDHLQACNYNSMT